MSETVQRLDVANLSLVIVQEHGCFSVFLYLIDLTRKSAFSYQFRYFGIWAGLFALSTKETVLKIIEM